MSIIVDLLDAVQRLTAHVTEETAAIEARSTAADLKALAKEKGHFADRIERLTEAMKHAGRPALLAEPPDLRDSLAAAIAAMNAALQANGRVIGRRMALSEGLLEAVLKEAKRQSGTQLSAYGTARPQRERAAAIAYNAEA